MNTRSVLRLVLLSVSWMTGAANAGTVIANSGLALDAADVRAIYNGDMQSKGGVRIVAVDNLADQERFLARIIGSDPTTYQNHWTSKSLREGLSPPVIDSTDAEVIVFVRKTPGGVGYISGAAPAGVIVVMTY